MNRKTLLFLIRTIIGCIFIGATCFDNDIIQFVWFFLGNFAIDAYAGYVSGKPFYDL